jgi:hypothetical protein
MTIKKLHEIVEGIDPSITPLLRGVKQAQIDCAFQMLGMPAEFSHIITGGNCAPEILAERDSAYNLLRNAGFSPSR